MTDIFISADNIISPVGFTTADNFQQLLKNVSGIKMHTGTAISEQPFYAALFENDQAFQKNLLLN